MTPSGPRMASAWEEVEEGMVGDMEEEEEEVGTAVGTAVDMAVDTEEGVAMEKAACP